MSRKDWRFCDCAARRWRRIERQIACICRLHSNVVRAGAAFGRDPGDVAGRILDVAGFAVDAVLGVDAELPGAAGVDDFVNPGRAIARRRLGAIGRLGPAERDGWIGEPQVDGLVLIMGNVGEENRG